VTGIVSFATDNEYCSQRADLDFWWPKIAIVLEKHNLSGADNRDRAECGDNPTYPVFLVNDLVIKFFGHMSNWENAFNSERRAHKFLMKDTTILAPEILGEGQLFEESEAPWPYIISTRVAGKAWLNKKHAQSRYFSGESSMLQACLGFKHSFRLFYLFK